jgi:oxygen-independent coproporphyrinogen-3 oxidase
VPALRHIYVHVPFCARRCSYCDFSIAVRRAVPVAQYIDAIKAELVTGLDWDLTTPVDTLYFGGGTPSRLGEHGVGELIASISEVYKGVTPGTTEITLEANPEDVTREAAERWVAAGVGRVSLGVQSFDPGVLAWMHRSHSVVTVRQAMSNLRQAGVNDISLDLIFALPDHLRRDWGSDLTQALSLSPDHLSLYGLTIEPHTPLGRWTARGEVLEAPEDRYADEFMEAHERLAEGGFEHYEVSNFARPGMRSRHNSSYWKRVPYRGLGPSAHSFDGVHRRWNVPEYERWRGLLAAGEGAEAGREALTEANRTAEEVYLGLRTTDGLDLNSTELPEIERWVAAGWGELTGSRLRLTPVGWLRLDSLAAALTAHRSR